MSDKNLQHVESVFHAALDLPVADRHAYLREACNGDEVLLAEVSSLISSIETSNGFMEQPVLTAGFNVLLNSSKDALLGKVLGCYRIIAPLGKGGMGDVYLAEDTRLNRNVALKFLSMEFVGDNWAKRQLLKEAQSVAMLDHPNICQVYGIEDHDERSFIVMQYVKGTTLAELIRKQTLTVDEVLSLAKQIVSALAEAHAHGIIHRDIKPKNIMVTENQQVKVLDFGLAKTVQRMKSREADDSISNVSQTGLRLGTVPYMSPEQLREERLDYRSDVFSVGIVLYEMLCGKNPFSRDNVAETISAILSSAPVPLQQNGARSGELAQIVRKCLEKRGEDRYQSANDLLIALDSVSTKGGRVTSGAGSKQHGILSGRRAFRAALALSILTLLCFVLYSAFIGATKSKSVAILPIANEIGDSNLEFLAEGLTETITTKLSRQSKLRVRPSTLMAGYKGKKIDPKQVGSEVGADAVLIGSISGATERQTLYVKLLSASDGTTLWEQQYPLDMVNVFGIEADIAHNITSRMEFMSSEDERRVQETLGPANPEARKYYWLGRHYWKNRGNNKNTLNDAISHFNTAIQLAPTYVEAYAGLADCYAYWNVVAYGKAETRDAMTKAVRAAKDALALNDKLPDAHTSLATVLMKYYWDWGQAENEFKQAIKLNPEYAPAHYGYSVLLTIRGRTDEAISEGRIALELDPFSPATKLNYCRAYFFARRFEESTACFDKLVQEFPDYPTGKYVRAWTYFHLGRQPEAIATFEEIYGKNPRLGGAALGYAYGQARRLSDAQRILNDMLALPKEENLPPQEIALIYYGMGDINNALIWFEKSAEDHFGPFAFLAVDPIFEKLRSDERFMNLYRRYDKPFPHPGS
jgi:eukaryotic-like serine/threonine-protein kinase